MATHALTVLVLSLTRPVVIVLSRLCQHMVVGSDEKFRARNPLFLELLSARAESYFQENFQKVSNISGNFPGKLAIFLRIPEN